MFSSFHTKLAGVTFGNCQQSILKWGHQDIGYFSLVRESENPQGTHTPEADRVQYGDRAYRRFNLKQVELISKIKDLLDEGLYIARRRRKSQNR